MWLRGQIEVLYFVDPRVNVINEYKKVACECGKEMYIRLTRVFFYDKNGEKKETHINTSHDLEKLKELPYFYINEKSFTKADSEVIK